MSKTYFKPCPSLFPLSAVMVSCGEQPENYNIITIAWTGIINSDPPMVYISVRPERHSFELIKKSGDFVINIPMVDLVYAIDYCGIHSGRKINKFQELGLTAESALKVKSPIIKECPVNIECVVKDTIVLGSHHMFLADVVSVSADESFIDKKGNLVYDAEKLVPYVKNKYYSIKNCLGYQGFSSNNK